LTPVAEATGMKSSTLDITVLLRGALLGGLAAAALLLPHDAEQRADIGRRVTGGDLRRWLAAELRRERPVLALDEPEVVPAGGLAPVHGAVRAAE
jgi:hypothetical protein